MSQPGSGLLPRWWARTNRRGAPVGVLAIQAVLGTLLSLMLLLVNSILGFVPASDLSVDATIGYVAIMACGITAICVTPFLLHRDAPAPPMVDPAPATDRLTG